MSHTQKMPSYALHSHFDWWSSKKRLLQNDKFLILILYSRSKITNWFCNYTFLCITIQDSLAYFIGFLSLLPVVHLLLFVVLGYSTFFLSSSRTLLSPSIWSNSAWSNICFLMFMLTLAANLKVLHSHVRQVHLQLGFAQGWAISNNKLIAIVKVNF